MRDYLKSCVENKVVLFGYLGAGASILGKFIPGIEDFTFPETILTREASLSCYSFFASGFALAIGEFGLGTVRAYRRARSDIVEDGFVSDETLGKVRDYYCCRKGVNLALREGGLKEIF